MRVGAVAATWKQGWGTSVTTADRIGAATIAQPVDRADEAVGLREADDKTLVEAFLSGRRDAFDVIVERHRRQVYQVCFRFVNNHEDASDLTQDVFVRAFKGLRNFKGDSALSTWLYRVGVNACLNRVAIKKADVAPLEAAQHVDANCEDPLEQVLRDERAVEVRQAIEKLPPKQRATLVLRIYQDLSHQEIAEILGSTVGAVKANFFHALGNLKRILSTP